MVLMPCSPCCGCNEPYGSRGQPSSVEVDITGSSFSASMGGALLGYPYTQNFGIPAITGTYSLAWNGFGAFVYDDANVTIIFSFSAFGGIGYHIMLVRPKYTNSLIWSSLPYSNGGVHGVLIEKQCTLLSGSASLTVSQGFTGGGCLNIGGWLGSWESCGYYRPGAVVGSLSSGCTIPGTFSYGAGLIRNTPAAWTTTTNSFPNSDYSGPSLIDWLTATLTVDAVRLLYGADVIDYKFGASTC